VFALAGNRAVECDQMQGRWGCDVNKRLQFLAATLAASMLVGGCGNPGQPEAVTTSDRIEIAERINQTERAILIDIQDAIALCMKGAGFHYEPSLPEPSIDELVAMGPDLELAKEYGYGIATLLVDRLVEDVTNPNLLRAADMEGPEEAAYLTALNGGESESGGCQRPLLNEFEEQRAAFNDGVDKILSEHLVVEATREWTRCLNEEGYFYDSEQEIFDEAYSRRSALLEGLFLQLTEEVEVVSERYEILADPSRLPSDFLSDLDQFKEWEIAVAVADVSCYLRHVEPVMGPMVVELEARVFRS